MTEQKVGTVTASNVKIRSFALTTFDDEDLDVIFQQECKYLMVAWEICPKTGRKHAHCAIYYSNARSWNAMKCMLPHTEIEAIRSWDNWTGYCGKDGVYLEFGTRPRTSRNIRGRDLMKMSEEEIADLHPYNMRNLMNARATMLSYGAWRNFLEAQRKEEKSNVKIIYITGNSGSGKTRLAWRMALNEYKNDNDIGYINFVNGNFGTGINLSAKCLIFDEFRDSEMKVAEFLKFTDKYIYNMNIKGSNILIRPEMIIFTSIKDPNELYKGVKEANEQFVRRITQIINL